jgi:site-specific recombinase XerD
MGETYFPDSDYPFRGAQQVRDERFAELRESLMYDLADAGVTEATLMAYWGDLDSLLWWCLANEIDILSVTAEDITRYLDELRAEKYSLNTIARRITTFRQFYDHIVAAGERPTSPMPGIHQRRPRPPRRKPAVPRLTARQRRRMLATTKNPRDKAVLSLLFEGVTVTQLGGADVADVADLGPGLRTSYRGIPENVELSAETVAAVQDYVGARTAGPLVTDVEGRRVDRFDLNRLLARCGKAAGIRTPVTPARLPQRASRNPRASSHTSSTD